MNSLYHEKQSRQFCLVHCLNALLQKKAFSAESADEICYQLNESRLRDGSDGSLSPGTLSWHLGRWFNPHRSWIGLGNYDVNVLMAALELHDMEATWFDRRKAADEIPFNEIHGLIFNIPSTSFIPFWNGRHWFTILRLDDGSFVNLDSKLKKPEPIADILEFSRNILQNEKNQLILVRKQNVH